MQMTPQEAAKVLREHANWRRAFAPHNKEITEAIDAAVAALEHEPKPAYCCAKCGLAEMHQRERVLAQDATRGNFRSSVPSGQDGIDGVHTTDIIPAAAIVGDDDGAAIIPGA